MRLGWGLFLLVPRTRRSKSAASRGPLYFAWGCFRDFCPGPAVHRRRDAMPGPGHEIVSASRLPDVDPTPTHHALECGLQAGVEGARPRRAERTRVGERRAAIGEIRQG